jgi:two-component system OmpR family sensor kinase
METTESLRCFAAGDFTPRSIEATGRNEIVELVSAYNGAAAQVASAFNERAEAEKEMRQFIADASHELRTPLTVIMGFIDVLRRRAGGDASTLRMYDTMQAEGRRMKMLVERLIVLARFDNPREHACEELEIGKIVRGIAASFEGLQPDSRIAFHIELDVFACAYENEMHEIVGNLLENALKYAPGSLIDIVVRAESEWAVIEVIDQGPGLSAEDQEHVFDRFYRGKNRGETAGFGLGLAIVKRAVERMGGRITLASTPGKGCRFTVMLRRPGGKKALPLVG